MGKTNIGEMIALFIAEAAESAAADLYGLACGDRADHYEQQADSQ
jgi:hypothetical protein